MELLFDAGGTQKACEPLKGWWRLEDDFRTLIAAGEKFTEV